MLGEHQPIIKKCFYDLLGMIRQLGPPTWFVSLTLPAADLRWPEIIQTIAQQCGTVYSEEDVRKLSFEEKCKWIRQNPVTAARQFQYRLNLFFYDFIKCYKPLGEIQDYSI